ncbi:MAG: acyltransferase family protein [Marmoricola sp.]
MSARRYESLDGLRGIAALVVVVHHALFTSAAFSGVYFGRRAPVDGFAYALTYSPLHLLWDGKAAVTVFFVLSGFVLALPFDGSPRPSWIGYYPRRLVRMFLPIWAAVLVALALATIVPRRDDFGSLWMNLHADQVSLGGALHDLAVVRGATNLDTPLWSMQWEVYFSALLPLFVVLGLSWFRRAWLLKAAFACVAGGFGSLLVLTNHLGTADLALKYLPIFAVGVCLASARDRIAAVLGRIGRVPAILMAVCALLMINAEWTSQSVGTNDGALLLASMVSVVGAALLVALFVGSPVIGRLGTTRGARWLGLISFSLYLIHEPIVVSIKNLLPGLDAVGVLVLSVAFSLPAAWVFFRVVEAPAHRVARRIGGLIEHRLISTHADDRVRRPQPHHPAPSPASLGS